MIILPFINMHSPVLHIYAKIKGNILPVKKNYMYCTIFFSQSKNPNKRKLSEH